MTALPQDGTQATFAGAATLLAAELLHFVPARPRLASPRARLDLEVLIRALVVGTTHPYPTAVTIVAW
ncbi:MAG: hypothetical protein ABI889_11835 [Gemmatimonadota bacterium]